VQVNGVSTRRQRLVRVDGVEAVEQSPGFLFWIKRPEVGDTILRTEDLIAKPWGLVVTGRDDSELLAREAFVRDTLTLVGEDDIDGGRASLLPLYRARLGKVWSSRPRAYQAKALLA
jgi:hypothetical protein